ncbi:hypothetical protein [Prosthecobacter fusiformis]|nr:hypothetical protein [Prosthecobacter fusiformis]
MAGEFFWEVTVHWRIAMVLRMILDRGMKILLIVSVLGAAGTLLADSYAPPRSKTYASPSGTAIVRVEPAGMGDPQVPARCRALVYFYNEKTSEYEKKFEKLLPNRIAPGDVMIPDDGRCVITFAEWHGGRGDRNTIVIHDLKAGTARHLDLADFLPQTRIDTFPRSTSSVQWRGEAWFDSEQRRVHISAAINPFYPAFKHPSFILHLETQTVSIDDPGSPGKPEPILPSRNSWWEFWK